MEDESKLCEVEIEHTADRESEFSLRINVQDWVFDSCKNKLRCFFDQILVVFLNDVSKNRCFRPLPVMNGCGHEVDLFKLYWIVRRVGGYDEVSRENLWGFVAEQCGLSVGDIVFLKLTYVKYLNEFDLWIRKKWREGSLENVENGLVRRLQMFSKELEMRLDVRKKSSELYVEKGENGHKTFSGKGRGELDLLDVKNDDVGVGNGVLVDVGISSVCDSVESAKELAAINVNKDKVNNSAKLIVSCANGKNCFMDADRKPQMINGENGVDYAASAKEIVQKVLKEVPEIRLGDGENGYAKDNVIVTSAKNFIQRVVDKMHDSPEEVRNGLVRVSGPNACDPVRPSKDVVEDVHMWKRKRESLCLSGMLDWVTNAAKQSDNPDIGRIPDCSKWRDHSGDEFWAQVLMIRELLLNKKHFCFNSEESAPQKKLKMHPSMYEDDTPNHLSTEKKRCSNRILSHCVGAHNGETETCSTEPAPLRVELSATETTDDVSEEEAVGRKVSVGPLYQAEVPEWTGVVSESDPKWLGTTMWPLEGTKTKTVSDSIGKGRKSSCDCQFPSSVQCVRFHTAENRHKLKLELGPLFHQWRFDRMGEEVSLSWTNEEEERFKSSIISNAATPNRFWNNIARYFPLKTKEMLVSYYFNVFLVKRRSYQNRVTPKDIDSDDDEKEFGSVGGSFGNENIHVRGSSKPERCTENKVWNNLE